MWLSQADNIRRFGNIPALKPQPGGIECIGAFNIYLGRKVNNREMASQAGRKALA